MCAQVPSLVLVAVIVVDRLVGLSPGVLVQCRLCLKQLVAGALLNFILERCLKSRLSCSATLLARSPQPKDSRLGPTQRPQLRDHTRWSERCHRPQRIAYAQEGDGPLRLEAPCPKRIRIDQGLRQRLLWTIRSPEWYSKKAQRESAMNPLVTQGSGAYPPRLLQHTARQDNRGNHIVSDTLSPGFHQNLENYPKHRPTCAPRLHSIAHLLGGGGIHLATPPGLHTRGAQRNSIYHIQQSGYPFKHIRKPPSVSAPCR